MHNSNESVDEKWFSIALYKSVVISNMRITLYVLIFVFKAAVLLIVAVHVLVLPDNRDYHYGIQ